MIPGVAETLYLHQTRSLDCLGTERVDSEETVEYICLLNGGKVNSEETEVYSSHLNAEREN